MNRERAEAIAEPATLAAELEAQLRESPFADEKRVLKELAASQLLQLQGARRACAVVALFERMGMVAERRKAKCRGGELAWATWTNFHSEMGNWYAWCQCLSTLIRKDFKPDAEQWLEVWQHLAKFEIMCLFTHPYMPSLVTAFERQVPERPLGGPLAKAVGRVAGAFGQRAEAGEQRMSRRLFAMLGAPLAVAIEPGEVWADKALGDISAMKPNRAEGWRILLSHCADASGSTPSASWRATTRTAMKRVGRAEVSKRLVEWFPLVDKPRAEAHVADWRWANQGQHRVADLNQDTLKGLCWVAAEFRQDGMARALARLALSAYRKVPGIGPRAVKVGNAAVEALGLMGGEAALGQLSMLRVKVKFGTAQKVIERSLTRVAEHAGLPRDEIDELGVPAFGFEVGGVRTEAIGNCRVEAVLSSRARVELRFFNDKGTPVRALPASVRSEFAADLKEIREVAKDAAAMLAAQRDRLDSMFCDNRSWTIGAWTDRYHNHPLVGALARRMIWRFVLTGEQVSAMWSEDGACFVDCSGAPLEIAGATGVRMWHPVEVQASEVLAWRQLLEDRRISQPFKQAHREVYLLTDAERSTETYSNRFGAHVLRQHQFNALCATRNWKNKLRLNVDGEFPPASRTLGAFGLRAEYWVDGLGEETNEVGVFNYIGTDQVRFYPVAARADRDHSHGHGGGVGGPGEPAPMCLEQVPALAFSEIMRDIDLFVGVASVGNNPQWQDGGPEGAFSDYWWTFGFGSLSESGAQRGEILRRLVPRLNIGPICEFVGHFLVVRGMLRTYKIHLGSGNILMEPNDEYLCIVPAQTPKDNGEVFLPFEGDRTLAIILSKALMLASDDKISDLSIMRQIRR